MVIYSICFPFVDTRIRARLFNVLKVNFPSIDAAEEHYNLTLSSYLKEMEGTLDTGGRGVVESPHRLVDKVTQMPTLQDQVANSTSSTRAPTSYLDFSTILSIEESKLSELVNLAFLELATRNGIDTNPDFATLAVKGMKTLKNHNKGNLIYKLAMCIAKTRPSTGQSLFPLDWMPFGPVEFQIEFFSATNIMGVGLLS